jgi:hypothetical protein
MHDDEDAKKPPPQIQEEQPVTRSPLALGTNYSKRYIFELMNKLEPIILDETLNILETVTTIGVYFRNSHHNWCFFSLRGRRNKEITRVKRVPSSRTGKMQSRRHYYYTVPVTPPDRIFE